MDQPALDGVDKRLARLETVARRLEEERRRWRITGLLAVAGAGLIVAVGAAARETPPTVEAGEFILRDKESRVRAALTIRPDGTPGLALFDAQRRTRLSLDMAADESTGVNLLGPGGVLRAALAIRPDGTPALGLFDETGRVVRSIDINDAGLPDRGRVP